jgi:hypothetical protein
MRKDVFRIMGLGRAIPCTSYPFMKSWLEFSRTKQLHNVGVGKKFFTKSCVMYAMSRLIYGIEFR